RSYGCYKTTQHTLANFYRVWHAEQDGAGVGVHIWQRQDIGMCGAKVAGRRGPRRKRHFILREERNAGAVRRSGEPELAPAVCRQAGAG
ncbi:hypothetical protein BTO25_02525, partial [Bacillus sp. MB366]